MFYQGICLAWRNLRWNVVCHNPTLPPLILRGGIKPLLAKRGKGGVTQSHPSLKGDFLASSKMIVGLLSKACVLFTYQL